MLQATALLELWRILKSVHPEWTLVVFTGFTMEELQDSPYIERARMALQCDILIDGRYVKHLNDGKGLRGSTNQRILVLTDPYRGLEKHLQTCERKLELRFRDTGLILAGIPPLGFHDLVDESLNKVCTNDPVG
jgi:anaerobic ribonucleoside-triphosphate reductase activating protein